MGASHESKDILAEGAGAKALEKIPTTTSKKKNKKKKKKDSIIEAGKDVINRYPMLKEGTPSVGSEKFNEYKQALEKIIPAETSSTRKLVLKHDFYAVMLLAENDPEALTFFKEFANENHSAFAMLALGKIYKDGLCGVTPDFEKAKDWFDKAYETNGSGRIENLSDKELAALNYFRQETKLIISQNLKDRKDKLVREALNKLLSQKAVASKTAASTGTLGSYSAEDLASSSSTSSSSKAFAPKKEPAPKIEKPKRASAPMGPAAITEVESKAPVSKTKSKKKHRKKAVDLSGLEDLRNDYNKNIKQAVEALRTSPHRVFGGEFKSAIDNIILQADEELSWHPKNVYELSELRRKLGELKGLITQINETLTKASSAKPGSPSATVPTSPAAAALAAASPGAAAIVAPAAVVAPASAPPVAVPAPAVAASSSSYSVRFWQPKPRTESRASVWGFALERS